MRQSRCPPATLDTIVEISAASCSDEVTIASPTTALIDEFEIGADEVVVDRKLVFLVIGTLVLAGTTSIWIYWNGLDDGSVVTLALLVISGWMLAATCIIGSRNLLNKRKEAYLKGEASQFSEYVKRVTNPEAMRESTVIGTGKPLFSLWSHPRKGVFV
ncbi:hypothetical protein L596_014272 [Steinernema carpocapsae]|uniref:Uncharacterized protein n=1 Tax=Steinernema carpocapsae TaxID=34508 RepID=A0A4U5NC85_STECR|nr:hypothetical protein L596_014272 [Steinernema carpocapsae]